MTLFSRPLLASAAVLFTLTTPVFSQSLAEEVIEEYFNELRQSGTRVEPGAKMVFGQTVEWKDIVISGPNGKSSLIMDFVRASEIGNGQVSVTYPEKQTMTMMPAKDGGSPVRVEILLDGMQHIISGSAAARQHDYKATKISYNVATEDTDFTMNISLNSVQGSQLGTGENIRHYSMDFLIKSASFDYSFKDGDAGISATGSYEDLAVGLEVDAANQDQAEEYLSGERGFKVVYAVGTFQSENNLDQPDFKGILSTKAQAAKGAFSVQEGVMQMNAVAENATYGLKFTEIPLPPFSAEIDSAAINFEMPLKQSDMAMPANLLLNMTGLKASDTLWGMIDPTASLPRDKATLNIDVSANMKWLVDLVKLDKAPAMPAEVQDVTINDITLEVAGARLNATGAATLDNSKMPPEPVGAVDVDLKGGIGLLDKLVALGLVQQEQGQMVKMFSGMFAVPGGDGSDHLKSKIEMKLGGSILVNGQRIK